MMPYVLADTVALTNHDILRGKVKIINNGELVLHTDYAGDITINMRYLSGLETDKFLWVRLKGQSSFKLIRFSANKGKVWMKDKEGEKIQLNDNRELAKISSSKPLTSWLLTGNAGLTFNLDDSSDNKESYGSTGLVTIKNTVNTNNFSWDTYYERNDQKVTSRRWSIQYNYQRYLNELVYIEGNSGWKYIIDQTPQSLFTVGPGIGYQFWDTPKSSLQSGLGIKHLWEHYANGETQTEWAASWNLKYTKTFFNLFNCYQNISLLQPFSNGLILNTETGCKIQLTDNLFFNTNYDYNYTSQKDPSVTVGSRRLSHILNFGVGVNW